MPENVEVLPAFGVVGLAGFLSSEIDPFDGLNDGGQSPASEVGELNASQDLAACQRNGEIDAEIPADLVQAFQQKQMHGFAVTALACQVIGLDLGLFHPAGWRHWSQSFSSRDNFAGPAGDRQVIAQVPEDSENTENDCAPQQDAQEFTR